MEGAFTKKIYIYKDVTHEYRNWGGKLEGEMIFQIFLLVIENLNARIHFFWSLGNKFF